MKKSNCRILVVLALLLFVLPTIVVANTYSEEMPSRFKLDSVKILLPIGVKTDSLNELNKRYEARLAHYENFWRSLIPSQMKLQYAGSIGVVSVGMGWHYGHCRRVWETDLYFGYLPRFHTRHKKLTMTVKQSYVPFRCHLYKDLMIEPLSCGIFLNTIFDDQFWASQPDKYPKHYYGFSSKVRTNIFVGERLRYEIPSDRRKANRSISAYYELSTNDLYVVSYATNKYISLRDILSLSIGLKFEFF